MTVETKTTIELSDIKAIEFECKNCGRIVAWPIKAAKEPPFQCDCNTPQWMSVGGDTYRSLMTLIDAIKRHGNAQGEPFILRLVVAGLSGRAVSGKD